jgi:hypothetical protein
MTSIMGTNYVEPIEDAKVCLKPGQTRITQNKKGKENYRDLFKCYFTHFKILSPKTGNKIVLNVTSDLSTFVTSCN